MWDLRDEGYTPDECREFDFAVVQWWQWFENKRDEQVQARIKKSDQLKDDHTWVRKYPSDQDILELYWPGLDGSGTIGAVLDSVDRISDHDLDAFIDEWDGDRFDE